MRISGRLLPLIVLYGLIVAGLAYSEVGFRLLSGTFASVRLFELSLINWVLLVVLRHPFPGERRLAGMANASIVRQLIGSLTVVWTALVASTGIALWFTSAQELTVAAAGVLVLMVLVVTVRVEPQRVALDLLVRERIAAAVLTALLLMLVVEDLVTGAAWFTPLVTGLGVVLLFLPELGRRIPRLPTPGGFITTAAPFIGLTLIPVVAFRPRPVAAFVGFIVLPPIFAIAELHATSLRLGSRRTVTALLEEPEDPIERALGRIKGTYRRVAVRARWEAGEDVPDEWLLEDVGMSNKFALGAQDPRMRGGEDLPGLLPGEVELARITLTGTVHGEVTSLRAVRTGDDTTEIRMVDEYETEFDLPVTRVSGRMSAAEVVDVFARAEPGPLAHGPFAVDSTRMPGLEQAFHDRFPDEMRPEGMPGTVALWLRLWGRLLLIGSRWAVRGSLDFRGAATTFEIRTYVTLALVVRSLVLNLAPVWAPALYLLLVPTPSLIVRRLRAIGMTTFREDLPKLLLGVGILGVVGASVLEFPLLLGAFLAAYIATILYVMLRKSPGEDEIVRRRIAARK